MIAGRLWCQFLLQLSPFCPVANTMRQLQVAKVRRVSTTCDRNYMVDAWAQWIRITNRLINRLAAYSTELLGCQDDPLICFKLRPIGPLPVWSFHSIIPLPRREGIKSFRILTRPPGCI